MLLSYSLRLYTPQTPVMVAAVEPTIGACVPSGCTADGIKEVVKHLLRQVLDKKVTVEVKCQQNHRMLSTGALITL